MAAGYDEWAVARTPSLLAFATALVEDAPAADAAVAKALDRMCGSWSRVSREDPDLEARRLVVRACSDPRHAAVVLRVLEERSDAEIGDILLCSEAAARRHLQRGLADLDAGQPVDGGLALREHLVARAGSAPVQLLTREATTRRAHAAPRRSHRASWLAGIAVVVLLGGVAYVAHESRSPAGAISYPKVAVPSSWRYESYAGVQLQVPDTFGWGSAPIRSSTFGGPRHLGSCGADQATLQSPADSSSYLTSLTRFVGRPAILNTRCATWGADGTTPRGEAVWFASPLAVGVREVEGNVAETRAVGGQHITVFGGDSAARRQILGTAEVVSVDANGCPTTPVTQPAAGPQDLKPESMSVCVYSQDTGSTELMYSGALPAASALDYAHAVASATVASAGCGTPQGRWVSLGLHGPAGTRWDVVDLGCDRIRLAAGHAAPIAPETVRDWAARGVTAYVGVPAGADPSLARYFGAPSP